jgi:hypothetical protein
VDVVYLNVQTAAWTIHSKATLMWRPARPFRLPMATQLNVEHDALRRGCWCKPSRRRQRTRPPIIDWWPCSLVRGRFVDSKAQYRAAIGKVQVMLGVTRSCTPHPPFRTVAELAAVSSFTVNRPRGVP